MNRRTFAIQACTWVFLWGSGFAGVTEAQRRPIIPFA